MTEQGLQAKITKLITDRGGRPNVIVSSKMGVADIIVCYRSKYIALEVKLPTTLDTVTPLQKHFLVMIRGAGGIGRTVSTVKEVADILDMIDTRLANTKYTLGHLNKDEIEEVKQEFIKDTK